MTAQNSVNRSLPKKRMVRGYEIRRMPIGAFLEACSLLEELPGTAMRLLFPGMDEQNIAAGLAKLDKDRLQEALLRAAAILPGEAVRLFARISGLDEKKLLEDPDVGLDGLGEMLLAWMEVNRIENFIKTMRAVWEKGKALMAEKKAGFRD